MRAPKEAGKEKNQVLQAKKGNHLSKGKKNEREPLNSISVLPSLRPITFNNSLSWLKGNLHNSLHNFHKTSQQ